MALNQLILLKNGQLVETERGIVGAVSDWRIKKLACYVATEFEEGISVCSCRYPSGPRAMLGILDLATLNSDENSAGSTVTASAAAAGLPVRGRRICD